MTSPTPFLSRILYLIEHGGLTTQPLALLALRDAIDAHDDGSLAVLREAVQLFHCSSLARSVGQHEVALAELDAGSAKFTEFCGVSPSGRPG